MPDQRDDAEKHPHLSRNSSSFCETSLDWPIESDDFEELTFDYTPEELGIDTASAAKIQEIKRLRPFSASQPWGIFFVKFEPKRLPVVALRRMLSRVVLKKRASANSADRAAWQADDLLFISNYGEGDERQISFAHFSQDGEKADLPTLKVLGWDNRDTPLHLDDVAGTLHEKLAWPEDDKDANAGASNGGPPSLCVTAKSSPPLRTSLFGSRNWRAPSATASKRCWRLRLKTGRSRSS